MREFLPFTYDRPGEGAAPLWHEGMPYDKPVSICWAPDISCSAEQFARGCSLNAMHHIPWHDMNIAEIWVESRKAYELLHRIAPAGQRFIVRIIPPIPKSNDVWHISRSTDMAVNIYTHGLPPEFQLAATVSEDTCTISMENAVDSIIPDSIAVFCYRSCATLGHLQMSIERQCYVLSSDAGASEEYLTMFARPGTWHVAHTWESREWQNMLLDLQGVPNKAYQTSMVDQSPYIKLWESK